MACPASAQQRLFAPHGEELIGGQAVCGAATVSPNHRRGLLHRLFPVTDFHLAPAPTGTTIHHHFCRLTIAPALGFSAYPLNHSNLSHLSILQILLPALTSGL